MIKKYPVIIDGENYTAIVKDITHSYTWYDRYQVIIYKGEHKFYKRKLCYANFNVEEWKYDMVKMIKRTVNDYKKETQNEQTQSNLHKQRLKELEEWDGVMDV